MINVLKISYCCLYLLIQFNSFHIIIWTIGTRREQVRAFKPFQIPCVFCASLLGFLIAQVDDWNFRNGDATRKPVIDALALVYHFGLRPLDFFTKFADFSGCDVVHVADYASNFIDEVFSWQCLEFSCKNVHLFLPFAQLSAYRIDVLLQIFPVLWKPLDPLLDVGDLGLQLMQCHFLDVVSSHCLATLN